MHIRATVAVLLALAGAKARADEVTLIGTAAIPGAALDRSGLTGNMLGATGKDSAIPAALFGGAGSGIDFTGQGEIYRMVSDRGPSDGDIRYLDRAHLVRISVKPGEAIPVKVELTGTTMLKSAGGRNYVGASNAMVGAAGYQEAESLRLDPEGVRCMSDGSFWISDEYGPMVLRFNNEGRQVESFPLPARYGVAHANADAAAELANNKMGRQPNRGMEGLALTPDHKTLVGLMQSCLIQDHGLDAQMKRVSVYSRVITMNLQDRSVHEYVYPLDSEKMSLNELLAINDHQFLAIERDGKAGADARIKHVMKIDLAGATDISRPVMVAGKICDYTGTTEINGLPASGVIPGVTPVRKALYLDMLRAEDHLGGAELPEKMEGLTWGPDFSNGDKLLIVTSDNDFHTDQATRFYAYRVSLSK